MGSPHYDVFNLTKVQEQQNQMPQNDLEYALSPSAALLTDCVTITTIENILSHQK